MLLYSRPYEEGKTIINVLMFILQNLHTNMKKNYTYGEWEVEHSIIFPNFMIWIILLLTTKIGKQFRPTGLTGLGVVAGLARPTGLTGPSSV